MTFIDTVPEEEATGAVAAMYETDREVFGYLPNFTRGYSQRPEVYAAWRQLNGAIKANMELRRYEIATLAAAGRLKSRYCCAAHGKIALDKGFVDADGLKQIVEHGTLQDEVDQAVIDLAVVLAAAVRSFFSKTLDGLGIEPDAQLSER